MWPAQVTLWSRLPAADDLDSSFTAEVLSACPPVCARLFPACAAALPPCVYSESGIRRGGSCALRRTPSVPLGQPLAGRHRLSHGARCGWQPASEAVLERAQQRATPEGTQQRASL